ncbi:MAG: hypothetical protein RLZZ366_816, partial [Pseudomonadota bacterium]
MIRSNTMIVSVAAVLLGASGVSARPKRTVVLLDFSQSGSAPAPTNDTPRESV